MVAARRRRDENLVAAVIEFFVAAPWWAGPPAAGIAFSLFQWVIPWSLTATTTDERAYQTFSTLLTNFSRQAAPFVGVGILFIWLIALIAKFVNRRRLDSQTGIHSIRKLRWDEFEALLAEAFRRQDYRVKLLGGNQPDGGVDIALEKHGEATLVQCKHWHARKVGVKVVRELLGSMTNARAQRGIVVSSGVFTTDAEKLARNNSIQLIDGTDLEHMIRGLQSTQRINENANATLADSTESTPSCPACSSRMVLRTAKKGPNPGSTFWGCSRYPNCRGVRQAS